MVKFLYWCLLAVIVIVLFGTMLGKPNKPLIQAVIPEPRVDSIAETTSNPVVTSTDDGYSPATVTIKAGSVVEFKNMSGGPVWTASARHPTHTVYPTTGGCLGSTFDACKGTPKGESWSFKFDHAGEWGYHDHLNAKHYGKIIVEK